MDFIPHTNAEIDSMLEFIGVESLDHLFAMIPSALRLATGLNIADGQNEFDTIAEFERMAHRNRHDLICFAGAGAYDHDVPSVVRRLAGRTEFITSYTPYQPEVAQGVLQALFEYQTLISRLTGLPIANASLYDGATACVEAANLSTGTTGKQVIVRSGAINPLWRETMDTMAVGTGHEYFTAVASNGTTSWDSIEKEKLTNVAAVMVQQPNYFGVIEDLISARELANKLESQLIVLFDPVAAGVLKTPGSYGADVVVGEGQPFGTPMSFGGPYLGLFACKSEHVRKLPGRLVGATVDVEGRQSYVTTLRTREQDIRREKATSNVCTNQTLIAITAAIQLSWLGTVGLRELALRCARGTRYLREALNSINGVVAYFDKPTFREFAVRLDKDPHVVIEAMVDEGFLAGVALDAMNFDNGLLLSVTEKRTKSEIDEFVTAFKKVMR